MDNTVYHERVNRLFDNVQRFRMSVQAFADGRGLTINNQPQPAMAGVDSFVDVTHAPISPVVAPIEPVTFETVTPVMPQTPAPAANDLVNEIDVDALLNGVDLTM